MKQGDIVEARLAPARMDDLAPGALAVVGETLRWTAAWMIGEDEGLDQYAGQWNMRLDAETRRRVGFSWAPECDLADVVKVGVDDDYAWAH